MKLVVGTWPTAEQVVNFRRIVDQWIRNNELERQMWGVGVISCGLSFVGDDVGNYYGEWWRQFNFVHRSRRAAYYLSIGDEVSSYRARKER